MHLLITKRAKALHALADAENEAYGDESPAETIEIRGNDVCIECTMDDIAEFSDGQADNNYKMLHARLHGSELQPEIQSAFLEWLKSSGEGEEVEEVAPSIEMCCPFCRSTNLLQSVKWDANTLEPRDDFNTATLDEWKCRDEKCMRSFWI